MADDEKKLAEDEVEENTESKDWQWDAAAPLAGDDFLDISIPEKDEEDSEEENEDEAAVDEEEDDVTENEEPEEDSSDEEEEVEDEKNDVPPGHCLICGEKIRNSMSECYCNECRSKYMKVDFGATHIVLSIVMVFVAIIGIVMFAATSKITAEVLKADKLTEEGKLAAAIDAYDGINGDGDDTEGGIVEILNARLNDFLGGIFSNYDGVTFFDEGNITKKKKLVLSAEMFSISYDDPEEFISSVDNSFTAKELESKKYAKVKGLYDYLKKFIADIENEDLNAASEPFFTSVSSGDLDEEETNKQIDEMLASLDEFSKKHPDIPAGTIAFCKARNILTAQNYYSLNVPSETVYKLVKDMYNNAGDYGYIFFNIVTPYAIDAEDYEEVVKISDKMIEMTPSSADAYYYKAIAYLKIEKYDDALACCDKVKELSPGEYDYCIIKATALRRQKNYMAAVDVCDEVPEDSKNSEVLRQEAIAYYLAGDEDNAVKYAKSSYDTAYSESYSGNTFSLEVVNTSALIFKLCGEDTEYENIIETIETYDAELEDSVMAVIKGDKTFEDLFMTGEGDV